jgi:hypothetical protein
MQQIRCGLRCLVLLSKAGWVSAVGRVAVHLRGRQAAALGVLRGVSASRTAPASAVKQSGQLPAPLEGGQHTNLHGLLSAAHLQVTEGSVAWSEVLWCGTVTLAGLPCDWWWLPGQLAQQPGAALRGQAARSPCCAAWNPLDAGCGACDMPRVPSFLVCLVDRAGVCCWAGSAWRPALHPTRARTHVGQCLRVRCHLTVLGKTGGLALWCVLMCRCL